MFPCSGCQRHILETEVACPFCGVTPRSVSDAAPSGVGAIVLATTMVLGMSGCARQATPFDGDTASDATEETDAETITDTTESGTTLGTTSSTSTDTSTTALSFYAGPDNDIVWSGECDPFAQDCPEGEKCVPYGSTGGDYDANKCVPVLGDGQAGDPCDYTGTGESTDDCDAFNFCWYVAEVDGMATGVCTPYCGGTADEPICAGETVCQISNEGSVTLCVDACDPLQQDCDAGQGCYWYSPHFLCASTTTDTPLGGPCGWLNDCEPGLTCLSELVIPGCAGSSCCAAFCSLSMPVCDHAGTQCVSFFEEGMAPMGYEDLGVCIAP